MRAISNVHPGCIWPAGRRFSTPYLVNASPSHVERISLRLYLLLVDFASALLRFAQVAYE